MEYINSTKISRNWQNGGKRETDDMPDIGGTAVVGSYPPNAWGLYDMHGNVWEVCRDFTRCCLTDNCCINPCSTPLNSKGFQIANKGGSWVEGSGYSRSGIRELWTAVFGRQYHKRNHIGFRLTMLSAPHNIECAGDTGVCRGGK